MEKKSDYSLFINFFFNSLKKNRIIHYILGLHIHYSLFFGSLFTIYYKKGHYSLIIIPHSDPLVYCNPLMLASHCPELDTRWPHEYGILNFARRWPRTWSPANQQPKQLRCLQKVTRWQPNHTRRQHEDVIFYQVTYPQDTRRLHDSYTTSY